MESLAVLNIKGEKVSTIKLNEAVWGIEPNDAVLYDAIRLAQNSLRQGTADTKTRSEVSGGGRKPYRQKGTGRARQGSTRATQWVGGGIAGGVQPRDYTFKMNKKERVLALKSALTHKVEDKELVVVENLNVETNKTKAFNELLKNVKTTGKVLVVADELSENLILASSNNRKVAVMNVSEINVLDLVNANYLIIDESSVKKIEEVLN